MNAAILLSVPDSGTSGPKPVFGNPGVTKIPVMVNITELEIPPPGPGLVTETAWLPVIATSDAKTTAVNWFGEI